MTLQHQTVQCTAGSPSGIRGSQGRDLMTSMISKTITELAKLASAIRNILMSSLQAL